jgi:hypothetical protein
MPSTKELEQEAGELSDRLAMLLTQTMNASASEMHQSKATDQSGQKIVEVIKEIIRDEGSLEDFFKIIPVKNAIYAGAFSLDSDIDHVVLTPVAWLTLTASIIGGLSTVGAIAYPIIMISVGRASLIADMGAGARISIREAYREGRMLSRQGGALRLAQQGRVARLGRMARVGKLVGRVSTALAVVAAVMGIVEWIISDIREKKYKKALQEQIKELKEVVQEVFSDRANFFYDDLQMQSLKENLAVTDRVLKSSKKSLDRLPTYEAKKEGILGILGDTREDLFSAVEVNQARTQEDLSALDKSMNQKTEWDGSWKNVTYTHDFTIARIRVISTSIVEAIQCISRDGREGIIYGGAQRIEALPEGAQWWTDEIVLAADEYITKAVWKKSYARTLAVRATSISGIAIRDLQITTNKRQLPLLGSGLKESGGDALGAWPIYYVDKEYEQDGFVLPVEGIMFVNGKRVDTSYKVTELVDVNVTMEKEDLDVVVRNTNFIENLKFVIEMNMAAIK